MSENSSYEEALLCIGDLRQTHDWFSKNETGLDEAAVLAQIAAAKGQIAGLLAIADAIHQRNGG